MKTSPSWCAVLGFEVWPRIIWRREMQLWHRFWRENHHFFIHWWKVRTVVSTNIGQSLWRMKERSNLPMILIKLQNYFDSLGSFEVWTFESFSMLVYSVISSSLVVINHRCIYFECVRQNWKMPRFAWRHSVHFDKAISLFTIERINFAFLDQRQYILEHLHYHLS